MTLRPDGSHLDEFIAELHASLARRGLSVSEMRGPSGAWHSAHFTIRDGRRRFSIFREGETLLLARAGYLVTVTVDLPMSRIDEALAVILAELRDRGTE